MTAVLTSTVAAVVADVDVELTKNGYSVGIVTFYPDGDNTVLAGVEQATLDVIACVLEDGWKDGSTDGYDWSVL